MPGAANMPRVGVWDQVLAFGQYQHATIDGEPVLTVFDATTCAAMLDDFAAHPENDIFADRQHEVVEELGDQALDREAMQSYGGGLVEGDGKAMSWANALAMVVAGKVVRYEAHPGAPSVPPPVEQITRLSDGTDRGDGVYALVADITPRGADPAEGIASFRFTSPYFVPERDGWRLLNYTYTNDPRMRGCARAYDRRRGAAVAMMRVAMEDPSGAGGAGDPDDIDTDDDGEIDVEHFPLPEGLLRDAGIESDEEWDEIAPEAMRRLAMNFVEDEHPRADDGKFATKGGGGGGGESQSKPAGKAATPRAESKGGSKATWSKAQTTPVPKRPDGKPSSGAGAQLAPEVQKRLKDLGISKLPAAHIADVRVSSALHDDQAAHEGALLQWKDDQGRPQRAYSAEFDRRNAEKKWERVLTNRPKVDAHMDDLRQKAGESPAHAAALLIALTGLRPGGSASLKDTGHYGATTMEARHVSFDDDGAHIQYVGKAGKVNKATVTDPALVTALKKSTEGKAPTDRVFAGVSSDKVSAALPKGVKTKDLRTLVATTDAERRLVDIAPKLSGDAKKDARQVVAILKAVSTEVSKQLNNTPAMARRSYIAPQVIRAWGEKHGLKPEWLGSEKPGAAQRMTASGPGEKRMFDKELMSRAGCMESDSPATQIEKVAKYIRKMEEDAAKAKEAEVEKEQLMARVQKMEGEAETIKEAMRASKMDVDPDNWAQNAAVHIKTGATHSEPGSVSKGTGKAERGAMEYGGDDKKEREAMSRALRAIGLPGDTEAAKAKLDSLVKLADKHTSLEQRLAAQERAAAEAQAMQRQAASEQWAQQALVDGRWDSMHKGTDQDKPADRIAMTRKWLAAQHLKDPAAAEELLYKPGTYKPAESIVMQVMTRGGVAPGAPDPRQGASAATLWAQKIDEAKKEDPKRSFEEAERVAMQRHPVAYKAYMDNPTMARA